MTAIPSMGDWPTWVATALSAITAFVAAWVFFHLRARERRTALADLHVSLTTGEIAEARHSIGTVLHGSRAAAHSVGKQEAIRSYFVLVWALQRARNVFSLYKLVDDSAPASALHNDAATALTWNLWEIARNVREFRHQFGKKWSIEDSDAWRDVEPFIRQSEAWGPGSRGHAL